MVLLLRLWNLCLKREISLTTPKSFKGLRQRKNCIYWFRNNKLPFSAIMVTPTRTHETNKLLTLLKRSVSQWVCNTCPCRLRNAVYLRNVGFL